MKNVILLLWTLIPITLCAQSVVFSGNVFLDSQAAVDAWDPQYTYIDGKLQITGTDVTDLTPLSNIDTVYGKLDIYSTDSLVSLEGLNVNWIGSNLYLAGNKMLTSLDGLVNLAYIGRDLVIIGNDTLQHLDGLASVDSLGRHLNIGEEGWQVPPAANPNPQLSDLCGIRNLITNGLSGDYFVNNNAFNPSQADLVNGDCYLPIAFDGNVTLTSQEEVNAFRQQYNYINGKLQIVGANIKDLSPLANVDTVFGKFEVFNNDSLTSLQGLNIEWVGSNVYVAENPELLSFDGMSSLTYIGRDLALLGNAQLMSLNGLENVATIARHIYIGEEGWQNPPVANGNPELTDFCGIDNALAGGFANDYFVNNNGYNPGLQDFADGNCAKPTSLDELFSSVKVYPNPVTNFLHIEANQKILQIKVMDLFGKTLTMSHGKTLSMENFPSGTYVISFQTQSGERYQQLIQKN